MEAEHAVIEQVEEAKGSKELVVFAENLGVPKHFELV